MKYISTRGNAAPVDFVAASLMGLAPDGGLFSPEAFPQIERPSLGATYVETATRVLSAFAGNSLPESAIREMAQKAYAPFAHQSVARGLRQHRGAGNAQATRIAFDQGCLRKFQLREFESKVG